MSIDFLTIFHRSTKALIKIFGLRLGHLDRGGCVLEISTQRLVHQIRGNFNDIVVANLAYELNCHLTIGDAHHV